jgi:hypothetical protein
MKALIAPLMASFLLIGCDDMNEIDSVPPAAPRGIVTISLDNAVEIQWLANTEPDVAGYKIYVSDRYDGRYEVIGTTDQTHFVDYGALNGRTVYYALSAYDYDRNESELSTDVVYDTPRPEGLNTVLYEYHADASRSGYDFSTYSVGYYNDDYTDFFFEYAGGRMSLVVWSDTDIQGMGFTGSLDDISSAPVNGWSPTKTAEAIVGHTYVIWTWDDHYAKVRIREVSNTRIVFDWAYQTATGNPELRVARESKTRRGALERASVEPGDAPR